MIRELTASFIAHTTVLGILAYVSATTEKREPRMYTVYRVKTVTSESIEGLLKRADEYREPKPLPPRKAERRTPPPVTRRKVPEPETPLPDKKKDAPVLNPELDPAPLVQAGKTEGPAGDKAKAEGTTMIPGIETDREFDFPEYLLDLRDRIQRRWRPPSEKEMLVARVFFRIAREGKVVRAFVEKPSGNMGFDASALNAVIACDPFPPLPEKFGHDALSVHFDFIFENG